MSNHEAWRTVTAVCKGLADAKETLTKHVAQRHKTEMQCAWAENGDDNDTTKECRDALQVMAEQEREHYLELLKLALVESAVAAAMEDPRINTVPRNIFTRALGILRPPKDKARQVSDDAEELSRQIIELCDVRHPEPSERGLYLARKHVSSLMNAVAAFENIHS